MSKDPRDEPRTHTDVNGDMYYITESGEHVPVRDTEEAQRMQNLEGKLKREHHLPMGMK